MTFSVWGIIPFAVMLIAIAVFPLWPPVAKFWEKRSVQLCFSLILGVPVAIWLLVGGEAAFVGDKLWEYAQFIILLFSLFVVSGGIFLAGDIRATPRNNTIFLAAGSALASLIGTTGAAMLLIRPVLNTNKERTYKAHTVLYLIFCVANCGGLLTPLGDPPLFLGLLQGVPFTWTLGLWKEWLFVNGLLLLSYYAIDARYYARESVTSVTEDVMEQQPLALRGSLNFLWLAMIVTAVAAIPSIDMEAIEAGTADAAHMIPWREIVMLVAAALSYVTTSRHVRFVDNEYEWGPIGEVAALFIGIFLTMMPALKFLAQVAPSLPLNRITFFAFSGSLSSVLDNAPTYLTFFEMAKTLSIPGVPVIAGVPEPYLISISLGAVLCGALTYIGNGPNFMVKSVADSRGVTMPSFGGYIGASLTHLLPVLIAMVCVFIAQSHVAHLCGVVVVLGIVGMAVRNLLAARSLMDAAHGSSEA
ncbi:MAG: sodium:proton antiporter [Actinomycetaceae bacterium]|nr:sodium:proton antiporter [Actinomycetaceae bacterium]MDY6083556.1 sodium:proton antiporter [Actinomycetaceae bacterium]